jgi:hypothetical protein
VGSVAVIFKDPLPSLETALSISTPDCVIIPSMLSTGNIFSSATSVDGLAQPMAVKINTIHTQKTKVLITICIPPFYM